MNNPLLAIKSYLRKPKVLITHNGKFHTDDVLAYAILLKIFKLSGERFKLIRTRDESIIVKGDIVFDIGNIYDPAINRYDHHQKGHAGERENTIPYAAAGLVWKHFGPQLCSSKEVWQAIDKCLVQPIDAGDNGVSTYTPNSLGVKNFSIGDVIDCFIPDYEDAPLKAYDEAFIKAANLMEFILTKTITKAERKIKNIAEAAIVYEQSPNKQIIVCEKYIPGIKKILTAFPEPLYAIYPDQNNKWRVEGVRTNPDNFPIRKNLPEEWGGLRDDDFIKICGIPDATFCHPGLFTAGSKTKEGAIALAEKAVSVQ
jgi:uncharacterized UPF0160 family protein